MENTRKSEVDKRRMTVELKVGKKIVEISRALVDDKNIHCENLIGAISIPLGVAGPVTLKGEFVTGSRFVPLATTEGALVASVNRGCKAINQAGGVIVQQAKAGVTRGPVFETSGIFESQRTSKWIAENFEQIRKVTKATSKHLALQKITTVMQGRYLYCRFHYDTDEAMGMNMVTIATDTACKLIENELSINCLSIAGNYDVDKKSSWLNFIEGRGRRGWAEVTINKKVVKDVLRVEPSQICKVVTAKCWGGSMMSGSIGFNAHFANMVAAFFIATGQDLAHVVEGSHGITTAELNDDGDLYFSIYMPAIMLGAVGGGTKLRTQSEARTIAEINNANELCEVLLAGVLAGELSLISSLAQKTLANSHKKLGR